MDNLSNFTKNDMNILRTIKKAKATNHLRSMPVSTISQNSNLSHTKVRTALKLLLEEGLVSSGFMQKNAKTFFITDEGLALLSNLINTDISKSLELGFELDEN